MVQRSEAGIELLTEVWEIWAAVPSSLVSESVVSFRENDLCILEICHDSGRTPSPTLMLIILASGVMDKIIFPSALA